MQTRFVAQAFLVGMLCWPSPQTVLDRLLVPAAGALTATWPVRHARRSTLAENPLDTVLFMCTVVVLDASKYLNGRRLAAEPRVCPR
jgi:hypothetical protein